MNYRLAEQATGPEYPLQRLPKEGMALWASGSISDWPIAQHATRWRVQARWELKRLPQRIVELQARVESISSDVAYRDAHVPPADSKGEKPFTFIVDGCTYTDRVVAAPPFAAAIQAGTEASLAAGEELGSCPSIPIATYRGFEVTVRPASMGTVRLGQRCPERNGSLEHATARTIDPLQAPACGTGLFQRLDHLSEAMDGELKAAQEWSRPRGNQPGELHGATGERIRAR